MQDEEEVDVRAYASEAVCTRPGGSDEPMPESDLGVSGQKHI